MDHDPASWLVIRPIKAARMAEVARAEAGGTSRTKSHKVPVDMIETTGYEL